jgi:hypothetical protein
VPWYDEAENARKTIKEAEMRNSAPVKPSRNRQTAPSVPKARTPLGKRLRELRERIVASGAPLLDDAALRAELRERRGDGDTNVP